jgi:hypothetical protein
MRFWNSSSNRTGSASTAGRGLHTISAPVWVIEVASVIRTDSMICPTGTLCRLVFCLRRSSFHFAHTTRKRNASAVGLGWLLPERSGPWQSIVPGKIRVAGIGAQSVDQRLREAELVQPRRPRRVWPRPILSMPGSSRNKRPMVVVPSFRRLCGPGPLPPCGTRDLRICDFLPLAPGMKPVALTTRVDEEVHASGAAAYARFAGSASFAPDRQIPHFK